MICLVKCTAAYQEGLGWNWSRLGEFILLIPDLLHPVRAPLFINWQFGMQLATAHITMAAAFLLLHGKIGNGAEKYWSERKYVHCTVAIERGHWLTLWLSQRHNKFFYSSANGSTNCHSVNKAAMANYKGRLSQDGGGGGDRRQAVLS